jgi:hypothetical protein
MGGVGCGVACRIVGESQVGPGVVEAVGGKGDLGYMIDNGSVCAYSTCRIAS